MAGRNILVTGATGFIGRQLVSELCREDIAVRALIRPSHRGESERLWPDRKVSAVFADLAEPHSLDAVCQGVDTVFHLAGHAHAETEDEQHDEPLHWRITVEGTRALLAEAKRSGVKRFIFVSSVKAMGEGGKPCLDETSPCRPVSPYGRAKLEAERLVLAAGRAHGMHVCVLRLPLVYGPGVKGNLWRMIEAHEHGRFPPLPEVGNRRSMVHVEDVVQALRLAADKNEAHGKVYIVTDGEFYSTRQLYTLICRALNKPVPRWAVLASVLYSAAHVGDVLARLLTRPPPLTSAVIGKLLGSACHRSGRIQREFGFRPTRMLADALPEVTKEYQDAKGGCDGRASCFILVFKP